MLAAQPNKTTNDKQTSANPSQAPVVLAPPEKQDQTANNKTKADPDPPKWYAAFEQPDGMLVIVGIATCLIIGWQSCETRKAAKGTQKAANAALLNAQAVINAERAWITVTPHIGSPKFYPLREKTAPIPDDLVDVLPIAHLFAGKLVNVGKTPAKIEAAAIRYIRTSTHPSELDATPDYGEISERVMFVFPNEVNTISAQLSPIPTMTQAQIDAVQDEKEFLYAFGIVKYRDVYGESHETRFGYFYQAQDRHLIMKDGVIETIRTGEAGFRRGGPPAYNGHT